MRVIIGFRLSHDNAATITLFKKSGSVFKVKKEDNIKNTRGEHGADTRIGSST